MSPSTAPRIPVENPILRGFNPDPSILRVGEDYYIATSTFEWYPGVQIHHSRDLANWRLLTRPLNRPSQLDMRGEEDSCGIWAPCLTYSDGLFYLIYTDVKRYGGTHSGGVAPRDMHNYLVTAEKIDGPWSEPIYLNSSGFDPSLFHDEDGRKYLVNMLWDHRPNNNRFAGIVAQQLCLRQRSLVGERKRIFAGTPLGLTEAPHIYRRNGWYYLITAEGGTAFDHAVTLARSKNLHGPYQLHPDGPLLTSHNRPNAELERAGHADWVDTPDGETYLVYLCGRTISGRGRGTLGRETALIGLQWGDDQWPRIRCDLEGGGEPTPWERSTPRRHVLGPKLPPHPFETPPALDHFDSPQLAIDFQWLRCSHTQPPAPTGEGVIAVPSGPMPGASSEQWFSLSHRPGHLRLYGRESLGSHHVQALIARRWQAHCFSASTQTEFEPEHFQQMAGLVAYYNSRKFHYLYITHDERLGKVVQVMSRSPVPELHDRVSQPIAISSNEPVQLRAEVDNERLVFACQVGKGPWQVVGQPLEATILSDEATTGFTPNFTGAFIGVCCQDMSGARRHADFDFFEYREREFCPEPQRLWQ